MLNELRVRNLAVIADVTIPLRAGLNVLTGETGAGKSMLIDALALLLGERASADLVRPGAPRAIVEAAFEFADESRLAEFAENAGVDLEDGRLVVRRDINAEGRNRAWANGSPATVAALASIGRHVVDLHGQHEAQSLLHPAAQREMLDAFGNAGRERQVVSEAFEQAGVLRSEEADLASRLDDIKKRADYLRHVAREIADAQPVPAEDEALAIEAARLANAEELIRQAEQFAELVDGEEVGALEALRQADRILAHLERIDGTVSKWREILESAEAGLGEIARDARQYAAGIELDPGRLEAVEQRRDVLFKLTQKYGPTIADVERTGSEAQRELETLDTADTELERLAERREVADAELARACRSLTARRVSTGKRLSRAVERLLPNLGLPDGRFQVLVSPSDRAGQTGADSITFLVQLNVGLDPRPLAQVASGGELSRIMLALKVVLAEHDHVPILVFDEIDQGIGAEVGHRVADALSEVARAHQVLVITHLPQIAARAAHHLAVSKQDRGGVATADVRALDEDERIGEIARMLGGGADPVLRQHAEELLRKPGRREPASR